MSDVLCRVCGEPWDVHHIRHDAPAWVAPLFFAGAGCESCEGVTPEGIDRRETAYRSDARLILDSAIDSDPLEVRPAIAGDAPPPWKRPDDQIVWQCEDCAVRVMRDQDWKEGNENAFRVEGCASYYQRRDLGIARSDTFETVSAALDEISHDGAACKLCRYPCGDCGKLIGGEFRGSYPDPRDPYQGGQLCEDCYSAAEYENAVDSFDAYSLARAWKLSASSKDWLTYTGRVTLSDVPSDAYEIDHEGIHFHKGTRDEIASYLRQIRKNVRERGE